MLLVAGFTTLLFKKLHQPLVLGYIVAGFLTGPFFNLFPGVDDMANIQTWSEIGIIILMFCLGLEFNLHKLASVGGTAIITAITVVFCMFFVGYTAGRLMDWGTMDSLFLGGMLSMSSTTIIIKAFDDLNLKGKKFTELVLGTLIIEDIAGIFMMVVLSTIAVSNVISGGQLTAGLLKMVFYLAVWLILGIYLVPSVLSKTKTLMNEETLLVVALGMCLGMVLLANYLGFSSALGAFLAGSLLSGTVLWETLEHITKPLKDFFGAIFFISVGMMVDPGLIVQYAVPIIIITIITICGQSVFSTIGVLFSGHSLRTAILCGCSLVQIGEFSFIIASLGISLGVTNSFIYPIIVAVSVITTFTTPFIIRSSGRVYNLVNKMLPNRLLNFLNRFTSENQTETEQDSDWMVFIKSYFFHLAIYTTIILGVIAIGVSFVWPFLNQYIHHTLASVLCVALILICISPFLRQNLMPTKNTTNNFIPLWVKSKSNHLPLLALLVIRLGLTVLLITLPVKIVFDFSTIYIIFSALVFLALIARSEWLIAPYLKIEARFLANFNERQLEDRKKQDPKHRWLNEQLYVSNIICDGTFPDLNKRLDEPNSTFSRLGIKIIKIIRNGKHINIPSGSDIIKMEDTIFLTGNISQLDNFHTITNMELQKREDGEFDTLNDFIKSQEQLSENDQLICYAVIVENDSDLIGLSIKDSKIKDDWGGLLLGLERNLYPIIYPDINMKIENDDLIWVLGPQIMASKMAKANVL
jgi:CPA2 family monovalent cation:H+ antiporter-2